MTCSAGGSVCEGRRVCGQREAAQREAARSRGRSSRSTSCWSTGKAALANSGDSSPTECEAREGAVRERSCTRAEQLVLDAAAELSRASTASRAKRSEMRTAAAARGSFEGRLALDTHGRSPRSASTQRDATSRVCRLDHGRRGKHSNYRPPTRRRGRRGKEDRRREGGQQGGPEEQPRGQRVRKGERVE